MQERIRNSLFTNRYTYVESGSVDNKNTPYEFTVKAVANGEPIQFVKFQKGFMSTDGVNGMANEDALLMVLTRLQSYQNTEFACRETAVAITKIEEAVMWLRARTTNREVRGILGTDKV